MANCWAMLLLMVGAAIAIPTVPTRLSYEQVLASAVKTYNQESGLDSAFRLLEAEPQQDWDSSAQAVQPLKFSVKETVCQATESSDIDQCDYKDDGIFLQTQGIPCGKSIGLDQDCSGFFSTAQSPPLIVVQCEDVDQELERITRGRFKKWKKKWKKKLRKVLKKQGPSIAVGAFTG